MQTLTVETVLRWLDELAPFVDQEDFDNAGFQLGSKRAPVSGILLALDLTEEVISEALALGANLIITHHPLLFVPQRSLDIERPVPRLAALMLRHKLSLIATHTNIDRSEEYSASVSLARLLGLQNIRRAGDYLFLGELQEPMSASALTAMLARELGAPVRCYQGKEEKPVTILAIAGGAYSEGWEEALASGAQALLTGEVRHHHGVEAAASGLVLLDGGHYATEAPMLQPLALGLQKMANAVEYSLQVHVTRCLPYRLQ